MIRKLVFKNFLDMQTPCPYYLNASIWPEDAIKESVKVQGYMHTADNCLIKSKFVHHT